MAKRRTEQAKKTAKEDSDLDEGFTPAGGLSAASIWSLFSRSRYFQLLLLLTITGGLLRFYNLGYNSLWLDEASTLEFARQSLGGIWESTAGGEFNPPLFYWIEHFMLAFGESEFVLRFVPALMGTASIPAIYLAGSAFRDRNTGIIAAGLLAFLPTHIYYSQEARAYAPAVFLMICAVFLYLRALRSGGLVPWLLFAVASALAFWMHFYVILGIGACFLHAIVRERRTITTDIGSLKGLLAAVALLVVLTLPLVAVTIGLFLKRTGSSPTFGLQGANVIAQTFVQLAGFNAIVAVAFLLLLCLGIYAVYRKDRSPAAFAVIFLVVPLVFSVLLAFRMPFQARHLIYLLPVYLSGIAASWDPLSKMVLGKRIVYLFIAACFVINLPWLAGYYTTYQKEDWRGFASDLSELTAAGDIVVVLPGYVSQPLDYYYSNATDQTLEFGGYTVEDLIGYTDRGSGSSVYYIVTGDIYAVDPEQKTIAWLQQHAQYPANVDQTQGILLLVHNGGS